jgi:diadenosine tetraphosphate (Ap4A) HIT family hydrolase
MDESPATSHQRDRSARGGSGGLWSSPAEWERAKGVDQCPVCLDGGPNNVLVPFRAGFATGGVSAPVPGYVCLVARRHVVEPFELPTVELGQFWLEAMTIGRALHALLAPPKINYEIHGNSMPHLHMHIYPRSADDPYVGQAIDWHASFQRSQSDLARIRTAIESQWAAADA